MVTLPFPAAVPPVQRTRSSSTSKSSPLHPLPSLLSKYTLTLSRSGAGTVTIDGFTVDTFGKLYRSCGNCKQSAERHIVVKKVKASNGKLLVGINSNFGDTATIDGVTCASSVKEICEEFEGTTPGNEPKSVSTGPSKACGFTDPVPAC
jgi:hypothetical protein